MVEPYVVAADVYYNPDHKGRGGWTWYTGSAAWMYKVIEDNFIQGEAKKKIVTNTTRKTTIKKEETSKEKKTTKKTTKKAKEKEEA